MAFVNELIRENDKARISSIITYEKIRERVSYVHDFQLDITNTWTCDNERDCYLICLVGKGREEQLACYALGIGDEFVIFNVEEHLIGDTNGIKYDLTVGRLSIPKNLEPLRETIKSLIYEALKERAYFKPFADGGTYLNPNTKARNNVISFNLKFK
ncbi:MAG: hypothetical protein CTY34_12330 [Methylobacter sp.]|nr:MAG: hypothetical protein CTY34_12330 [Methylobacter sp.]